MFKKSNAYKTGVGLVACLSFALFASSAGSVSAKAPLGDNEEVFERLFNIAVANEIRDNCSTISARMFRALGYLAKTNNYAKSLGYSAAEIKAFTKDKVEQEKLRVLVYAYLDEQGVDRQISQSYCPLGKAEIKQKTAIGRLLRSR